MELFKLFLLLGFYATILMHTAQSYVLITANFEDIKKLAKKFISKPVALQISEFLAKVEKKYDNISEVNLKNEANHVASNENLLKDNEKRVGKEIKQKSKKQEKQHAQYYQHKFDTFHAKSKMHEPDKLQRNFQTGDHGKNKDIVGVVTTTKSHPHIPRVNSYLADYELKIANIMRATNQNQNTHNKQRNNQAALSTESFSEHIEKLEFDKNPRIARNKFLPVDVGESAVSKDTDKFLSFIEDNDRLTSRKDKTEFDQYDYTNYPNSRFVATSGPVALPKLSNKVERGQMTTETEWF